jgi:hypothetical protein
MKKTEEDLREIVESIKVELRESELNSGLCCDFKVDQDSYYADLANLPWIGTECMIFEKAGDEIQWDGLYCRRDIPYSQNSLLECITEFIRSNYVN